MEACEVISIPRGSRSHDSYMGESILFHMVVFGIEAFTCDALYLRAGVRIPSWSLSTNRRMNMDNMMKELQEIKVVHQDIRKNTRNAFEVSKVVLDESRQIGLDLNQMDSRLEDVETNVCIHVGELEELQKDVKGIKDHQQANFEGLKHFLFSLKGQLYDTLQSGNDKIEAHLVQLEDMLSDLKEEIGKQSEPADPENYREDNSLMEDDSHMHEGIM